MTERRLLIALALVVSLASGDALRGSAALAPPDAHNSSRTALFWLEPYANLTSVAAYKAAWAQFGANARPGYLMAGSAYEVAANGSLVFASRSTGGQLDHGRLMEAYGFAALRALDLRASAMVYLTRPAAIAALFARPQSFVRQLLAKAAAHGLAGFDLDFEPAMTFDDDVPAGYGEGLVAFLGTVGAALREKGLLLTLDIGSCGSSGGSSSSSSSNSSSSSSSSSGGVFPCSAAPAGLLQANTMSTFPVTSLASFEATYRGMGQEMGELWAPGFEPANLQADGGAAFKAITQFMAKSGVRHLSTWQVHECDAGAQPAWLFDAVNAFLDAPQ